jgi:hypothetical protein
MNNFTVAV